MKHPNAQTSAEEQLSISEQLVQICSAAVNEQTRNRAALHVLDWLGCILSGATTAPGLGIRRYSRMPQFAVGKSFVCGENCLDASAAAFVNGSLGNILEMDDVHRASILHAGDIIIPAVLATAQENDVSMTLFLDSIVRGYEVALRLGSVAASGGYSNWYNSGTCGIFGAASACAYVLQLDDHQHKDCLGQAGMLGSGIWQCRFESTWSKQLASANAARNGVVAASLGEQRFPGARFIFEGEAGFFPTYYPGADIKSLSLAPVDTWALHDVSFKPWPACRHNHPAIEAALRARENASVENNLGNIASIEIETYQAAIDFCDNENPVTDHNARFSLQHCIAVALSRGEPAISDFEESARSDVLIGSLREKTSLTVGRRYDSRFPQHMGSAVTINMVGGESIRVETDNARGDPENPMSMADIKQKFYRLAAFANVSEQHAEQVVAALLECGANDSMLALNEALANTVADFKQQRKQQ